MNIPSLPRGDVHKTQEHSVRTQSRVPNNDEHKWTPRPEERKQRQREREREINGLQGNVSEAKRGEKDVYICSSMHTACLCLGALGDVLKAVVMNAALSPVASFISGRLSACSHCRRKPGRASSLFTVVATLKTSGIRNESVGHQRKFDIPEERKEQNLGGRLKNCLQAFLVKFWQ